MRRFTILNPQGERVGEGVEWSDGHFSVCSGENRAVFYARAAFDAWRNEGGDSTVYLDPPGGEAGKEEPKWSAFDFEAERRSVGESIAAREERMVMGARRTKHRFSVEEPKEEPKPRKLPSERIEELTEERIRELRDGVSREYWLEHEGKVREAVIVRAVVSYLDEQAREREGSG